MGEMADDCYDQGLNDYYDLSDEDRHDADWRMFEQQQINERRAQWRRNNRINPTNNPNDEAPF